MDETVAANAAKIVVANLMMFLIVTQLANLMVVCRVFTVDLLWTFM